MEAISGKKKLWIQKIIQILVDGAFVSYLIGVLFYYFHVTSFPVYHVRSCWISKLKSVTLIVKVKAVGRHRKTRYK